MARLLLILALTLSASLAGAVEAGHVLMIDHDHSAVESIDTDTPMCCESGVERSHSCLSMPALYDGTSTQSDMLANGRVNFDAYGHVLTGIEPSGPVDPPRMV
jgi:hypothetical protein